MERVRLLRGVRDTHSCTHFFPRFPAEIFFCWSPLEERNPIFSPSRASGGILSTVAIVAMEREKSICFWHRFFYSLFHLLFPPARAAGVGLNGISPLNAYTALFIQGFFLFPEHYFFSLLLRTLQASVVLAG